MASFLTAAAAKQGLKFLAKDRVKGKEANKYQSRFTLLVSRTEMYL